MATTTLPAGLDRGLGKLYTGLQDLGIKLPRKLTEAAQALTTAANRATTLPPRPKATADDLLAEDWADRLTAVAADRAAHHHLASVMESAVDDARNRYRSAGREALPEAAEALEAWYQDHYDELAQVGTHDGSLSVHRLEALDAQHATFTRTLSALLETGGGTRTATSEWFTTHQWTPEQYNALVEATGPNLSTKANPLALARALGATARLARSWTQAETEAQQTAAGWRQGHNMPATHVGSPWSWG